jgi:hypothetical protein
MTPSLSEQFYSTFHPEVARGFLEGDRLRIHAAKVSVVREGNTVGFAIDTLNRDGRPAEWERTTQKIGRILKSEVERMPRETKQALIAVAHILPDDEPLLLFQIETWLSMQDGGGSWWEVPAYLSLAAISLPDVVKAAERAKKRVLRVVCRI